jgi:large subunit ribosomal protein L10
MTREEKANIIQNIKTDLDGSPSIYITDCSGLDAVTTSKLRRA